jgi:plastocyanin
MRRKLTLFVTLVSLAGFATPGFAKDVYLSVGGSVGNFRTDARIANPSFTKDITITARYLPAGPPGGAPDNSGVATKTITVTRRSMAVYDDVVQSLFGGGPPLGAVRLTSDDDFVATQRIYADESASAKNGTLGQFVPGLEVSQALKKGVLIQLKANGGRGTKGTFRTNWGGVNPNDQAVNVKYTLYDKNNQVAGTNTLDIPPFGVISPTEISGFFGAQAADLSNAWISFDSPLPVFFYASVLDNGSEDPTFIPASNDTGVAPVTPQLKTVTVTAHNWEYDFVPSAPLAQGDQVRFVLRSSEGTHGFQLVTPGFDTLISETLSPGQTIERTITITQKGQYTYFCTFSACGIGHTGMTDNFTIP